jgi:O-antigen/teichoic acid export membrane protein
MSRTRRIFGGTSFGSVHQAAVTITGLWLTPFLLHRVGQHQYGLWLVAGQLLAYLTLLDLGVIGILPREVAFASGQPGLGNANERIAGLIAQVRQIVRWQLPVLSVACGLVWWFLPAEWSLMRWPLALVFVAFIALYPLRILTAALQGVQELPFLAKSQLVGWSAGTIVTLALVLAGKGLYSLVIGWAVTTAIPAGAAWWRARHLWGDAPPVNQSEPVRPYFQRSIWVSVGQIAQALLAGSDVLLLGKMLGPAAIVPYACTGKLVTVFANHPQLLMHVAQPALSELRVSESRARLATVATALTQAMLMMSGALLVVILAANHYFVNWWVGPTQYGGWKLSLAFAAMMLLRHWNIAVIYTLFCFGYERQISLTSLGDGVVTAVGTVLLVSRLGPIGAPLASMLGLLTVSLPFNLRSVAHEMGLTVRSFLSTLLPLFMRIVAISAAAALGSAWIGGSSLGGTLVLLVLVATAYAAATVPIAWKGPVGPYLRMALPMVGRGNPISTGTEGPVARPGGMLDRWRVQLLNTKQG